MSVPEATVYKYHRPIAAKYKIGLARKIFGMQAITKPSRVQALSNQELRLGVPAPDFGHNFTSFFGRNGVRHQESAVPHCMALLNYDTHFTKAQMFHA